ncbi:MAG: ChbG/HpnK family deacetylase [Acidimicrobiales bacterium]
MTRPLLIVNADDYGLTEAVSTGILRGHRFGVVSSTSVLAVAPAFATCGKWLADEPDLGVGAHLAAVGEDPPLLSAREVPTLVDRRGRFPATWRAFLQRDMANLIDPADLFREFAAQIDAIADLGVVISHIDTHQHLHLWPKVRRVVLDLALAAGVPAVRVPRSHRRHPVAGGVKRLSRNLAARAEGAGLCTPVDAAGIDEVGSVDAAGFEAALDGFMARRAATAEIGTHPGEADDPDRHRYHWGYQWGAELELLTSGRTRRAIDQRGFQLGSYHDLVRRQAGVVGPSRP